MSLKTLLWVGVFVVIGMAIYKHFRTDTANPNTVLEHYLSHWESNNSTGMYTLISEHAKSELRKHSISNVAEYYSFFADTRADIIGYELVTQEMNDNNGRYWVHLKTLDMLGKEFVEDATFYVIKEGDGWRVDGWQKAGKYNLP